MQTLSYLLLHAMPAWVVPLTGDDFLKGADWHALRGARVAVRGLGGPPG